MNPAHSRGEIELHRKPHNRPFGKRPRSVEPCGRAALWAGLAALALLPCAMAQSPAPRFVVVLDAAHGGNDPGAKILSKSGGTEPEKDITLALSVKLRSLLAARGIAVVTTREADVNLDAQRRAEIANHAVAQVCLTLHASMSGSGVHLFLSSLTAAEPARFAAWRTAQAAWVEQSLELAGTLRSALVHAGTTVTLGRTALTTVDSMTCPAVAVEMAPDSRANGGRSLDDPDYQARMADALAAGLLEWKSIATAGKDRLPGTPEESRQP